MQNRLITDSFVERFKNDATGVGLDVKPSARRCFFRVGPLNVARFLQPRLEIRFYPEELHSRSVLKSLPAKKAAPRTRLHIKSYPRWRRF